ncbi:MAG: TMEM175 family protein [Bacteroidales bacterium]|jgi:uncharacterized membrane protein|nr:TMEM175 family protein [Bacteroidales bacterium]
MKNNVIDKNRLENFSDGVIAILITILVMAFKIPDEYQSSNYSIGELMKFLIPQLIPYAISFLVIAVHLINHHILFSKMSAVDSKFIWLNLLFLFSLSLIVYPTELLGQANNQETSAMLLIGAYFFKAISFRILHYYAIFRSGFYKTDKTKKELVRIATINWIKGPAVEIIAFGLIYLDYRYSLVLIFITTIYEVIMPKRL